ncbi:DUF4838 domain-containing protein [uncultured Chitinophaga sp.]|uniref:DUF4838 domain-containing protein n=1 Tax=uncultured Chitinophaga sp. TaxID=339340 RepID=UPI0025CF1058|nr:DUF4838 domain-containing protein [uncultured Chitinophaga sp.]
MEKITLVSGNKSLYTISANTAISEFKSAANLLQTQLKSLTDVTLPVKSSTTAGTGPRLLLTDQVIDGITLPTRGIKITVKNNNVYISVKRRQDADYAVYKFMEYYAGCKLVVGGEPVCAGGKELLIPVKNIAVGGHFDYGEMYFNPPYNATYRRWHQLEFFDSPDSKWGLWGHSFFQLLPPQQYFVSHPEYYSFRDGKRISNGQLCLSNPQVEKLAAEKIKQLIASQPGKTLFSISQEDNDLYCLCPHCYRLDQQEHSHGASVLDFVNRLAARFPRQQFVMLAYHYTFTPPATIVPRNNVTIQISTINAYRDKPIATAANNAPVREGFNAWKKKNAQLMVWDYVTNFNHFLCPYPNFETLKANVVYFRTMGIKSLFTQGNNHPISEFAELKCYVVAELMQNPDADMEALMQDFVEAFYGKASAPYIQQYITAMRRSLVASGKQLGLGDNPADHANGYLSPAMLRQYDGYLAQADKAAGKDEVALYRIRLLKLNLAYVKVEQLRQQQLKNAKARKASGNNVEGEQVLLHFLKECREMGVKQLDDVATTPEQYATRFRSGS